MSTTARHPYANLPARSHWRSVAGSEHPLDIGDWYRRKFDIGGLKIGTAGSCFAQHIGRHLRRNGFRYVDVEPAPSFLPADMHAAHGYGIYSARYGNVYTTRQLLQLLQRATGEFIPVERGWLHGEGWVDPFRPGIEPAPTDSLEEIEDLRRAHLAQIPKLLASIDVFVFTLGLTEAWVDARDGAVYPIAPGVNGGTYDPALHRFANFSYPEVLADMQAFIERARLIRPGLRFLLTVSPVALMATASGEHVVPATTYSKSVLRAVAGDLGAADEGIDYFPSYEIITSPPMRGFFYNADMRTVNRTGVDHVMRQFFREHQPPSEEEVPTTTPGHEDAEEAAQCDEEFLRHAGAPT